MEYFAGLDVSIEETAICVVGDDGKVVLETEVPTEPELIAEALERFAGRLRRVGHEAGSVSPWLHAGLIELGLPAVCLETRHVRAALSAQRNKTDAADALGIAHIMRTGWFRQAHIKTEECYRIRLLLVQRRNLKRKSLDIENAIRHSLKVFGIRLGKVGRGSMAKAVRSGYGANARARTERADKKAAPEFPGRPFFYRRCSLKRFRRQRSFGSIASRRPSPMKFRQNSVTIIVTAGPISVHGAGSMSCAPAEIRRPSEVSGSCTPSPRKDRKLSARITTGIISVT